MKRNPQNSNFEDWELETARILVRKARRSWKKYSDRIEEDDLIHDCLLQWIKVRHRYTEKRNASKKTYMSKVITNHLKNIIRKANSSHEKVNHVAFSIHASASDDDRSFEEQIPSDTSYLLIGIQDDIAEVLSKLTPIQKSLCSLLTQPGANKKKAAEELGIHRSLAYRELDRIRDIFEQEGLKEYLKKFLRNRTL